MPLEWIALVISACSAGFAIAFGLRNQKRADTASVEERARENAIINVKLDGIADSMRDMKVDLSSIHTDIREQNDRLVKAEESLKQAHKRIDGLEQRVNGKEV